MRRIARHRGAWAATFGLLAVLAAGGWQVVHKISDYSALTSVDAADLMVAVDVSDTSMGATGTTKKVAVSRLFGAPSNGNLIGWEGAPAPILVGSGLSLTGTGPYTLAATGGGGGSGTVTTVSVASANGLAGTVANATTTPAITLSTSVTGVLKGNGTAISAATAGSDYQAPITLTTAGSSGAATFVGGTLNIPQYAGGSGSPGGSSGQLQVNSSGSFGGTTNVGYDATNSTLLLTAISDPATPAAGDLWYSSTTGGLALARNATMVPRLGGPIWAGDGFTAVANSTGLTNLFTGGTSRFGTRSIPGGTVRAGNRLVLSAGGHWSSTGTPTLLFSLRVGTTVVAATAAVTLTAAGSNSPWHLEPIEIYVPDASASGSAWVSSRFIRLLPTPQTSTNGQNFAPTMATPQAATAIDWTATQALNLDAQWGTASASNSINIDWAALELR